MLPSIGSFTPNNPFFLAPMEAVNCASFRVLCKRRGASLVYTDMIDVDHFVEYMKDSSKKEAVEKFINPQKEEQPLAIQIGGRHIENCKTVIDATQHHATLIDLNIGCPLPYMLGKKGGVYLSKHPEQLYPLVKELRSMIKKPFTVKLRSGWDQNSINAVEVAKKLELLGVDAITLHPRTRKQTYRGRADWVLARKVKEAVSIPFILSGDVTNTYMAHMAFAHTKCDYVMCARGAQNNPSIFTQLNKYWKTQEQPRKPITTYNKSAYTAKKDFKEFLTLYKTLENRYRLSEIKDHALWTARECKHNKQITQRLLGAHTESELVSVISESKF